MGPHDNRFDSSWNLKSSWLQKLKKLRPLLLESLALLASIELIGKKQQWPRRFREQKIAEFRVLVPWLIVVSQRNNGKGEAISLRWIARTHVHIFTRTNNNILVPNVRPRKVQVNDPRFCKWITSTRQFASCKQQTPCVTQKKIPWSQNIFSPDENNRCDVFAWVQDRVACYGSQLSGYYRINMQCGLLGERSPGQHNGLDAKISEERQILASGPDCM